jgi:asparagine synthase (glutamine-hydrolysing)
MPCGATGCPQLLRPHIAPKLVAASAVHFLHSFPTSLRQRPTRCSPEPMPSAKPNELAPEVRNRLDRIWAKAYAATTREDLRSLYKDWADTYDADHEAIGFFGHRAAAQALARYTPFPEVAPVLDAGCGTGAAGEALRALGFRNLTGVDLSRDMLDRAREKGLYRQLDQADLGEEHVVEEVRAKLLEAVQLRLVADVPVGCYLSGGIDSCSMLGLSAAVRQDPVRAFTIGFDSADYDETPIAQEMARSVGAEQDVLRLDASSLYDHFVATHWHTERTIYNTLGVAKFLMSRHVRDVGYKVVITGEGSDELFAGYPSFRADLFRHGLDHLPAAERALLESGLAQSNQVFQGAMLPPSLVEDPELTRVCGFTPTCLQPWLHAAARVLPIVAPDRRRELVDYSPGAAIAAKLDREAMAGRHPLDVAQYVWIKTMLEGQILTWGGDRVDMAHSLEARPAFLDHHLAEYAATIPPHHRIRGAREKHVLREAVRGVLPKVLYEREKFAFMAPPAHTDPAKRAALHALAAEYLSPRAVASPGLLDGAGVQSLLDQYSDDEKPRAELVQLDALVNHMLGVQILHEQLIADDVPARAAAMAARADVVTLEEDLAQTGGTTT